MKRCLLLIAGCVVAFGSMVAPAEAGEARRRPNFVFVYTDDQRWDAMGVVQREQGAAARFPWFQTPNMDRLAAEGVRFRNAFVTNSLCAPARATFLSGQYNHANGVISVAQVVQKSSNVGAVKIALQMQPREMWELFSSVGFGQKPQLPFPGLASGRLRPYRSWRVVDQATMSYGYGLSVSVLQLARAYTVFANGGVLMPVSLLRGATPVGDSAAGVRIFSANTAAEVCKMLQMVTSTGGTAPKAQTVGYSVGGKTGTAYKQVGRHYDHDRYGSWFVGLAPLEHPRIVVAVMIDDPSAGLHFGGDVAAPVFSSIVEKTLSTMGVAPDLTVQPQIVAQQSVARPTATPEVN